jgi:hypothetical protein
MYRVINAWISGAEMGLNEEHNEQNQQRWLSRVAQERQGLSVSVAETLGSSIQEEFSWSEDDERGFSAGYPLVQGKTFVPPRLGLQSRVVETVLSESAIPTDLDSSAVVLSDEVDGQKPGATTQNTNILLRFAQRLTASFGALNTNTQSVDTQSAGQLAQTQPMDFGMKASALASIADVEVCTASTMTGSMVSARLSVPPTIPLSISGESVQARQRLAGRTTKIRLEVVRDPDGKKMLGPEAHSFAANEVRPREVPEVNTTGIRLPIVPTPRYDANSTSMHLPAMSSRQDAMGLTSAHMRTVDTKKDASGLAGTSVPAADLLEKEPQAVLHPANTQQEADQRSLRGTLSGTARFESGQREITVQNSSVTTSSVVLVTLTTNPGPVVVQYISLQPHTGFTVHLTAPTSTSSSFNYVVLLAELF